MPTSFQTIRIGSLEIGNRLVMAPMKTAFGTRDGQVTAKVLSYFRRRARGGVGLVISEPLYVDKKGQEHPKQLGINGDYNLDGLRRLVEVVHGEGARVFAHLNHAGRASNPKASGTPPEAPSAVPCPTTGIEPEVLAIERIEWLVQSFARAAGRARVAGFDGVELQFGLGYLVAQFLSPATNLRDDAYGGDIEGGLRFAKEVFEAVRGAVGSEFPICARISGSENAPHGLEIDDALELSRRLESWGANAIHVVSGSSCESPLWYYQHMALPTGVNETLAARIKEVVGLPIMAAGRLGDPRRIREILYEGLIDMVALGRPLLADPDLPNKMLMGRDNEVLLCGHCLQGCLARVKSGKGIGCNINPFLGREAEELDPVPTPIHVVVVGGGPAGMQAALTADRRGHWVTLFEKGRLGGQFALAFLPPGKDRLKQSLRSMVAQIEGSEIELCLGEEATVGQLKTIGPDAVILATGSRPVIPAIPGLDQPMTAEDVLSGKHTTGEKVLVLGGGMVGMEVAEFLASQGRRCTVVEMLDEVAQDMAPINRKLLMKRLEAMPVEIHTRTQLVLIEDGRAVVDRQGATGDLGTFDSVVVTIGNRPFTPLLEGLHQEGIPVGIVGDAHKPASIYDAVISGHEAAMAL